MTALPTASDIDSFSVRTSPVTPRERIAAMDVLRGVALLGILIVNMTYFGMPFAAEIYDPALVNGPATERATWWIVATFFQGKFITLFSLLFGAGLCLQMMRMDASAAKAAAEGRQPRSTTFLVLRRLFLLALVGLLHGTLVWYGDVLLFYATLGWVLLPLRVLSNRALLIIAACFVVVSLGCMSVASLGAAFAPRNDAAPLILATDLEKAALEERTFERFQSLGAETNYNVTDDRWRAFETAVTREGPTALAKAFRLLLWVTLLPITFLMFGPHTFAMFLIGMVAARAGWLAAGAATLQRRAALIGIPLGTALAAFAASVKIPGSALMTGGDTTSSAMLLAASGFCGEAGMYILALGYAGAVARFTYGTIGSGSRVINRCIANAGRMAFTIYLSMSVLMTGLMYWWGMGRFGSFTRLELVGIAVVTWTTLVLVANGWLAYFRMGPLEWLWRAGTYLTLPPLRRTAPGIGDEGEDADLRRAPKQDLGTRQAQS